MTQPVDGDQLRTELGHAIAAVLGRHEQSMTTKWLALVETIDDEGQRGLWTFGSEGIRAWDSIGLLAYAYEVEKADIVASRLAEGD